MADNIIRKHEWRRELPVEDIRRDYALRVSTKELLVKYSINKATLYRVLAGTHWQLKSKQ